MMTDYLKVCKGLGLHVAALPDVGHRPAPRDD
jgi:hypothetical protein